MREKLIKIGAKVVRHSRKIVFQMAGEAKSENSHANNGSHGGGVFRWDGKARGKAQLATNQMGNNPVVGRYESYPYFRPAFFVCSRSRTGTAGPALQGGRLRLFRHFRRQFRHA